ncbi:AAA family ATPase [Halomonas organivorans]|uniref:RNA polymerase subunit sigma-70 n=1 Tax=Halomonas organivorans TaxID=257772 RepID=A0A7W5BW60_9GAMM|nr:AAA family ATPase [Halomonas organivorans]MBB3140221.1 hypothetical protein [Halomonas organivorans]
MSERDTGASWLDERANTAAKLRPVPSEGPPTPPASAYEETAASMALKSISLGDFLGLNIPPRTMLLAPWLPTSGLAMVYAPRGIGKTWFAMYAGYAVAAGGSFLGWEAPSPAPVLYLDGEMPAIALQERFASIIQSTEHEAAPEALQLLTPDLQPRGMPDLSTVEGQTALEPFTDPAKLIVVDNIATLCRTGKENEGESWLMVQEWALRMRAQGKTVLFVHHAGKGGQQRGTSRREDVLDTVIALRYPKGEDDDAQGAKFELHFEKNRGFYGDDAKGREIELVSSPSGGTTWSWLPLQESTYQRVVDLLNEGLSPTEAARELDIHKSTATRYRKRAERDGLLAKKGGGE